MNNLRLELRTRNNILWHAIFDVYPSVAEFCRAHSISSQGDVGALLNLKQSPFVDTKKAVKYREFRPLVKHIANVCGLSAEEMFPAQLYAGLFPVVMVAEVEAGRFVSLNAAKHLALPPNQEADQYGQERASVLREVLETLTPREQKILQMIYGIDREEMTPGEIADSFGINIKHVRNIQHRALRKLRDKRRVKTLKTVVEPMYVN